MRHSSPQAAAALPHDVWQLLAGVEHWPEWTEWTERITRLEPGPLVSLGSLLAGARIRRYVDMELCGLAQAARANSTS